MPVHPGHGTDADDGHQPRADTLGAKSVGF